jgi:hypothetical protein
VSVFHLISILNFLNPFFEHGSNSTFRAVEDFLVKLVKSENWLKDYFRSEHRNFESAILFDDPKALVQFFAVCYIQTTRLFFLIHVHLVCLLSRICLTPILLLKLKLF